MNASIFWRLVWKEYRIERAFWISMAALAVFLQLLLLASASFVDDSRWAAGGVERMVWLFGLAMALPAFYALGCGATLFATEHEAGTFDFQRMLPVSAGRLFWGKLVFPMVSTLAMITVLWPAAILLAGGRSPGSEYEVGLWALWGFAAVELFVWGVLFSLLSKQPLKAAILAVTCASISVHLITSCYIRSPGDYFKLEPYLAALPPRVAMAAFVALLDVWLGLRWFSETLSVSPAEAPTGGNAAQTAVHPDPRTMTGRFPGFGRLVWHAFRQSASMIGLLSAIAGAVVLLIVSGWFRDGALRYTLLSAENVFLVLPPLALMGACVFLGDQRREGFRFLADRGVGPGSVWLSRQLVPMAVAAFWTFLALLLIGALLVPDIVMRLQHHRLPEGMELVYALAGFSACAAIAYAAGQLSSIVFRSGILAGVFGLVLAGLLCVWAGLMWLGSVPLLWSVAPIPLVLLLATWVRTPAWLRQRGGLRGWLPMGLVLAVPAAALLVAVPLYRAYEIPLVNLSNVFSPEEFTRPLSAAEEQTRTLYRKAIAAEDEEEAFRLAEQASRGPWRSRANPQGEDPLYREVLGLARKAMWAGKALEDGGRLDESLRRYLTALRIARQLYQATVWPWPSPLLEQSALDLLTRWAGRPDQTPERITAAIRAMDELDAEDFSVANPIKWRHLVALEAIAGDPEAASALGKDAAEIVRSTLWFRWMPWERTRAQRLFNLRTQDDLARIECIERLITEGRKVYPWQYARRSRDWLRAPDFDSMLLGYLQQFGSWDLDAVVMCPATRRRAARLVLAIQAWKLEHGELPETLDVLVGPYLDRVPLDPYSAEPFRWFPQGLPVSIIPPEQRNWVEPEDIVQPNTPLIWSAGPHVYLEKSNENLLDRANLVENFYGDSPSYARPTLEMQVWAAGWAFRVP